MEMLREGAPFLLGMVLPPVVALASRAAWTGRAKFAATFVSALILGVCVSVLAGEWATGLPDAVMATIIDTSLVYTGSQLAYRLFWKPAFDARQQRVLVPAPERARR
jgi:hypothetical protein